MAEIINGKALALKIKDELKVKVSKYSGKTGRQITLAVVLVGENPASQIYVKNKMIACEYVGIKSLSFSLPSDATENDVKEMVLSLANDDKIDGILVQLPLPEGIDEKKILALIPPEKDVDGFNSFNVGKLFLGQDDFASCTPSGVIKMLESTNVDLTGKHAVVLGRSIIVGKPMSVLLLNKNCTVTVCHSKTVDLKSICKQADIIVSAVGKPKLVTADMVKKGVIVIDVGITRTEKGLVGDVDFEKVSKKASYISPVPGGVGPMTIAMLLENTYKLAVRRNDVEL